MIKILKKIFLVITIINLLIRNTESTIGLKEASYLTESIITKASFDIGMISDLARTKMKKILEDSDCDPKIEIIIKKYPKNSITEQHFIFAPVHMDSIQPDIDQLNDVVSDLNKEKGLDILEKDEMLKKNDESSLKNEIKMIKDDIGRSNEEEIDLNKIEESSKIIKSKKKSISKEDLNNKNKITKKLNDIIVHLKAKNSFNLKTESQKKDKIEYLETNNKYISRQINFSKLNRKQTTIPPRCNEELINAFGVYGKRIKYFQKTETLCRRNQLSCCDEDHINSTRTSILNGMKELNNLYKFMEETYTLFKGPKVHSVLHLLKKTERCHFIIQNHSVISFDKPKEFFGDFTKSSLNKIKRIIFDLKSFIVNNNTHYANILCTICNPFNSKYFDLNPKGSSVTVNYSACSASMEILDFELRMMSVYNNFIKVITDLYKCKNNWTADTDYGINPIEYHKIEHLMSNFKDCYHDFSLNKARCLDLCKLKNFGVYKLPIPFFESLARAAKVLFPAFMGISLKKFYEETDRAGQMENIIDKAIYFYPVNNPNYINYKIENLILKFDSIHGIRINSNKMSHSYFQGVGVFCLTLLNFMVLFF